MPASEVDDDEQQADREHVRPVVDSRFQGSRSTPWRNAQTPRHPEQTGGPATGVSKQDGDRRRRPERAGRGARAAARPRGAARLAAGGGVATRCVRRPGAGVARRRVGGAPDRRGVLRRAGRGHRARHPRRIWSSRYWLARGPGSRSVRAFTGPSTASGSAWWTGWLASPSGFSVSWPWCGCCRTCSRRARSPPWRSRSAALSWCRPSTGHCPPRPTSSDASPPTWTARDSRRSSPARAAASTWRPCRPPAAGRYGWPPLLASRARCRCWLSAVPAGSAPGRDSSPGPGTSSPTPM
jgi:hypothetical protein